MSSLGDSGHTPFSRSPLLSKATFPYHDHEGDSLARTFGRSRGSATNVRVTIAEPATSENGAPVAQANGKEEPLLDASAAEPLLPAAQTVNDELDGKLKFAYNVSWVVNILLFAAKGVAWYLSHSKSVLASLVDSFVDLVSQAVIFVAEWQSKVADPEFPVGKARLETIGVLACACIMSVAAYAVIQDSGTALYMGVFKGLLPELDASVLMYSVLGAATLLKVICYILCVALQYNSDSMLALAEDHLNDIVSNVGAAIGAAVASFVVEAWWVDPMGGILISLFILWRWYDIARSQIEKIVGRSAPSEVLELLREVASEHHPDMELDALRAYHYGSRFLVEAEVVMPMQFTLKEVHDISLSLQHKLEALAEVERAFVHVDYAKRDEPEHRTERLLAGLPVVAEEALLSPVARTPGPNGERGERPFSRTASRGLPTLGSGDSNTTSGLGSKGDSGDLETGNSVGAGSQANGSA